MSPVTLAAVESAVRAAFSRDLCAEDDLPYWTPDNPSRGHCAITALTLNDLLGGDLLIATVSRDGVQSGYHYWNRLADLDVDLTCDQFLPNEIVGEPEVVARPESRPKRYGAQYDILRSRVYEALGLTSER